MVRFQVLTVTSMKVAVFWVVAPCSLAEINCHPDDEGNTSETLASFYQTTQCNIPKDNYLQKYRHLIY
jgi:hypothetical protein